MNEVRELDFCLLIPCYNNFEGLIESLKTVSYPVIDKYLILIIDDGSDQPVEAAAIKKVIGYDKPLVVLNSEKNEGITAALNKGLEWIEKNISPRYIARLDCGDTCTADRFTIQVAYMDAHPDIGLMGSWCWFEEKNTSVKYSYTTPTDHAAILKAMHFRNVFIHPTVMFRSSLLKKNRHYPADFAYAEDYAFFWRMIKLTQSTVLDKFLVTCEINREGLSFKNKNEQVLARWKVVKTHSTNPFLRIAAFIRLFILFIIPKQILLRLKK